MLGEGSCVLKVGTAFNRGAGLERDKGHPGEAGGWRTEQKDRQGGSREMAIEEEELAQGARAAVGQMVGWVSHS